MKNEIKNWWRYEDWRKNKRKNKDNIKNLPGVRKVKNDDKDSQDVTTVFKMKTWNDVSKEKLKCNRDNYEKKKELRNYLNFLKLSEFVLRINSGAWLRVVFWGKSSTISFWFVHKYICISKHVHSRFSIVSTIDFMSTWILSLRRYS